MGKLQVFGGFAIALCGVFLFVPVSPSLALDVAVPYVKADFMWAQSYLGDGVEIGIIDLFRADKNHPAISGNYLGFETVVNGAAWVSDHATLVTGAAVSQDATHTGVAPEAGWWTIQSTNRGSITSGRRQTRAAEILAQGLGNLSGNPVEVINLSIGLGGSSSGADQWSLGLDHIIQTNGQTITVAAGNTGPSAGTVSGLPPGAYNVITVGATGDTNGTSSQDYSNVASYSSRGPTSDGRSKPDIVAPGSLIRVPVLSSGWADASGTSLASPIVAGGAALLIDMGLDLGHSTAPELIKSVLLNSADKLSGWSHTSTQPLDYNQGAGQLNLEKAYYQYLDAEQNPGTVAGIGWDEQEVDWESENLYTISGLVPNGEILSATLAWNRIVSTDVEDIDDVIYSLDGLDNLDLYLYEASDLNTPVVSSISTIDNVEHIYYSVPQDGNYVLGVKMNGALIGDLETYGLAWHTVTELPGDFDGDGDVDGVDFGLWQAGYPTASGAGLINGDADADGDVDGVDFGIWQANYPTNLGGSAAIPEPATLAVLALGGFAVLLRRKR